ncbi:MAG: FtsX-like permease family protein, partial [Acidimicrobiales bacterium]
MSFVTGTFVLTDTLTSFFDQVFQEANAGTDVIITPPDTEAGPGGDGAPTEYVPGDALALVQRVPGVAFAEGQISGSAQMLERDGTPIGGQGPPTLGFSYDTHNEFSPLTIRDGRPPRGPSEVAIDVVTARRFDFGVGDAIKVIAAGPAREFTIAAVIGFGKADNLGGATLVVWDLPTAAEVFGRGDRFDSIVVKAADGTNVGTLIERLDDEVGDTLRVRSGDEAAADSASSINQGIQFFGTAMLFFAGIAIFVGAFIIANTFSIIVSQRSRELALLRSLGASRTQVMLSVLGEAAIVGVVASAVGIGMGVLVGSGLRALVDAISGGGGLPGADTGLQPRTIVVGLLVGSVTTILSALVPAMRGSREPPVLALHNATLPPVARVSLRRSAQGLGGAVIGALVLSRGLFAADVAARFAWVAAGVLLVFLGLALLSPLVTGPVARVLGAPVARVYGVTGRLARENAVRNPQRTAATAAALMIGLAMVAAVATAGASMKASVDRLLANAV